MEYFLTAVISAAVGYFGHMLQVKKKAK